jgi:4-hydroxybenzoate polyprenyltransferase/phosphoserine phosphatase
MVDTNPPLVVDLDGTLFRGDMLWESIVDTLKRKPLSFPRTLFALVTKGKAEFKRLLSLDFDFESQNLPLREEVLHLINTSKASGSHIVLSTGADILIATKISGSLGIFDAVIGSTPERNNSGANKASDLVDRFGSGGFDYIGDSIRDIPVWQEARKKYSVVPIRSKSKIDDLIMIGNNSKHNLLDRLKPIIKTLRPHQWVKNVLIFAPAFAAQKILDGNVLSTLLLAFVAFSLVASAVYIFNDILDIQNDRSHETKRFRPIASGRLSVPSSVFLGVSLLVIGLAISYSLSFLTTVVLATYFFVSLFYSTTLKRIVILDAVTLAGLYTSRLVFGAVVADTEVSTWLLGFSLFLFFSLALVKRYSEASLPRKGQEDKQISGRGYRTSDIGIVSNLGVSSGLASVIVFSLYLTSESVLDFYGSPELLWWVVPVLLTWISWIWIQVSRGEIVDDPIVFALRDRFSSLSGLVVVMIFVVAQNL